MLSKIADFYDEEVDAAVSGLLAPDGAGDDRVPRRGGRRHGHIAMYLPIFDMVNAV